MIPWPFPRSLVEKLSESLVMSWRWSLAKLRKRDSGISIHAVKILLDTSGEKNYAPSKIGNLQFLFCPICEYSNTRTLPTKKSFNSWKTPSFKPPISNILRVKSPRTWLSWPPNWLRLSDTTHLGLHRLHPTSRRGLALVSTNTSGLRFEMITGEQCGLFSYHFSVKFAKRYL